MENEKSKQEKLIHFFYLLFSHFFFLISIVRF